MARSRKADLPVAEETTASVETPVSASEATGSVSTDANESVVEKTEVFVTGVEAKIHETVQSVENKVEEVVKATETKIEEVATSIKNDVTSAVSKVEHVVESVVEDVKQEVEHPDFPSFDTIFKKQNGVNVK